MKAGEFVTLVQRHGRKLKVPVRFDPRRGKGSHGRLYYGGLFTTVPDLRRELKTGTLHGMLADLGLKLDELK